eukprot:CAMPEP_0203684360 /NCGR_PEP_ID=MMETSP0090-20130426/47995_1 /ASSEMBLY_ACC=CAM_ASM_001088 /TAXON_ID=426623 /ORGANISM="Chaetoceros affinis, Strain CCMP159" /LENGTH=375 /DNA_ID=CAMNT_0050553535 /DNA_START=358 /DNA_END=1482 /DNA_ORIENTATION=+
MTNQRYYNNNNIHTRLFYSLYFVLLTISVSVQKHQGHETIGNTLLEGSSSSSGTAVAFIIQPQFSSPVHRHHRHHLHNNYCTITSTSTCTSSTNTKHKRNVFVCQYSNSDSNSNSNSDNDEKKERNANDQSDNEETNFNNAKNNDKDNSVQMNAKKDNKNNNITNNSTLSQSPQPISSILYEDEECFDLCDVFEEDGNAGSSDEDNIEINELNKSQNSIPQPTSTASTSDKTKTTTASTSTAMSSTPPTSSSSSSSSSSSETKEYNKDPKPTKQVWQNLELRWSIDENNEDCDLEDISSCSEPCLNCRGTGVVLCQFCDGHGYVDFGFAEPGTMGKRLLGNDNPNGRLGAECPVCNEDGEQGCPTCRGSGWIARW